MKKKEKSLLAWADEMDGWMENEKVSGARKEKLI